MCLHSATNIIYLNIITIIKTIMKGGTNMNINEVREFAHREVIIKGGRVFLTKEQVLLAKELYKAHFTAKEATDILPCGYQSLADYWRRFRENDQQKYNRLDLIQGGKFSDDNS